MRTILTTAMYLGLSTAALASGPVPVTITEVFAPPVSAMNWTGAYAGVQLGVISSAMDLTGTNLNNLNTMASALDPSGGTLGIFAGYNWHQSGSTVFGIEGEINASNASASSPGVPPPSFGFMRDRIDSEINGTAALRLRVGTARGNTLFYASAGLAMADVSVVGVSMGGGGPFNYNDRVAGWTLGIGAEQALRNGWTVRADYRFSDYGNERIDFVSGGGDPHLFNLALRTHELRVGLARRF